MKKILGFLILSVSVESLSCASLREKYQNGEITYQQYYNMATCYVGTIIKKCTSGKWKGRYKIRTKHDHIVYCYISSDCSDITNLKHGHRVGIKISPNDTKQGRIILRLQK